MSGPCVIYIAYPHVRTYMLPPVCVEWVYILCVLVITNHVQVSTGPSELVAEDGPQISAGMIQLQQKLRYVRTCTYDAVVFVCAHLSRAGWK